MIAWADNVTPTPRTDYAVRWVLDTAGTISTDTIRISMIQWIGCDTDSDDFVLNDSDDALVWQDTDGETGKAHVYYFNNLTADGLKLATLDSGTLVLLVMAVNY